MIEINHDKIEMELNQVKQDIKHFLKSVWMKGLISK